MKIFKIVQIIVLNGLLVTIVNAQTAIPAAAGGAQGNDGTVSYSIGQIFYTTDEGSDGTVSKGIQQAYEIATASIENIPGIVLEMLVYPNPVINFLTLRIENDIFRSAVLTAQLYDLNGRVLKDFSIESNETNFSMEAFVPAIYFLRILQNNKEIKVFKIVKTQ